MNVIVHRGTGQIGGNLVEISTERTRLLFDAGANLPPLDEAQTKDDFELEGLTCGTPSFDCVFLSHHHHDHCGLISRILPGIPVFAGKETTRILNVIADFTNQPRPPIYSGFHSGQTIVLQDIHVTPLAVEHSARDSYMFLIQSNGKSILYTGDFRNAGQIPEQVRQLLNGMPLDLLITEGTNIRTVDRGPNMTLRDEQDIEVGAIRLIEQYHGTVFVLCSSTNEERIQSICHAATKVGRTICEDLFQTTVRNQYNETVQVFVANPITKNSCPMAYPYFQTLFEQHKLVGAETLAKLSGKKIIFVRTSMKQFIKHYLKHTPTNEKNLLIYSMWHGYKITPQMQDFLSFCQEERLDIANLHCSGHAVYFEIRALIKQLSPSAVLPIHCEKQDRARFSRLHSNCLLTSDGEKMEL